MPRASTQASSQAPTTACHLRRLVDFAEPRRDDTCLDVASGTSGLAAAIRPRVRELTSATAGALPSGRFTLVTARLALGRAEDQIGLVRDLLQVCGGRLVLADLVRTRAGDGGHIERLRDPAHTTMRTMGELVELLGRARRLDATARRLHDRAARRALARRGARPGPHPPGARGRAGRRPGDRRPAPTDRQRAVVRPDVGLLRRRAGQPSAPGTSTAAPLTRSPARSASARSACPAGTG